MVCEISMLSLYMPTFVIKTSLHEGRVMLYRVGLLGFSVVYVL